MEQSKLNSLTFSLKDNLMNPENGKKWRKEMSRQKVMWSFADFAFSKVTAFTAENISFGWKYTKQKVAKKTLKALHFWHKWLLCSAEWKPTACPVDLVPCRWSWASSSPIPQWGQSIFRISFVFYILTSAISRNFLVTFPSWNYLNTEGFQRISKWQCYFKMALSPFCFIPSEYILAGEQAS